ncbi:hypothetical protein KPATCC21470_0766 [Kitasatospora purpeofusca]
MAGRVRADSSAPAGAGDELDRPPLPLLPVRVRRVAARRVAAPAPPGGRRGPAPTDQEQT